MEEGKKSLEEIIAENGCEEEYKAKLAETVEAERKKAYEEVERKFTNMKNEPDKMAKTGGEEEENGDEESKIKELEEREKAIIKRELTAEAKDIFAERKIPLELTAILDYSSEEACKASIETVASAFEKAVETATEARLIGGKSIKKPQNTASSSEKQLRDAVGANY